MADAALGFFLDNLKQLVAYNGDLICNVRDEVDGLIRDLANLNAFIEDSTETGREFKVVKQLVIDIRDLTYEAEDAIDAFVVEATVHKARNWVQKVFGGVDHASKLHDIANKVKKTREDARKIYQNPLFGFEALKGGFPAGQRRMKRSFPDIEKDNVVGFNEAATALIDQLTGPTKDLQVISIIGMGGLGKTTLATKVYNDPRVSTAFSTRTWIYVSQTYSKKDLFLSILKGVTQVTSAMSDMDEEILAEEEVCRHLTWKYLVVVDDVWEEKDWTSIKKAFPNLSNGSRILLTSRLESVAMHADPRSEPHKLNFLTHHQSWELLQRKVFGQGDCPEEDLKEVGVKIAKQCDGLPLAVVVIAGMLQLKKSKGWWETVAKSVSKFLVRDPKDCIEVLALSYYHLPPHLKACFLYFGVFPEDYEIPVWILVRLWIAEGFVQKIDNVCLEEMAEEHLENLVVRNLVLVVKKSFGGQIKTCRIHDMLRELCLREAQAENFFLEIKGNPSVSTIYRRLCIHSDVLNYISSIPSGPRVRSFLCFAKNQVNLPPEHVGCIPKEFKLLRVFHIQPIGSPRFPNEIEQLVHLRYVAFSGNFRAIPTVVSNLWNLQTLIVKTSSHTLDIQADIWKMLHLRHLHTNRSSRLHGPVAKKRKHRDNASLTENPQRKNESLQTLSTIMPESCTEDVLGQTPFLKKLGIRGKLTTLLEDEGGSLMDNISKLQQLVTLKFVNDVFPLPPSESKLQSLPQWSKFPPNLKRLTLTDTFLDWKHMSVLEQLPKLEELKLKDNAFIGLRWSLLDGVFKKLKVLQIWKTDLVYWEAQANNFPRLQHIVLKDCMRLWAIPSSLGNLITLRTIKLHQTSRNVAASARDIKRQQQESNVYNGLEVDIFPSDL